MIGDPLVSRAEDARQQGSAIASPIYQAGRYRDLDWIPDQVGDDLGVRNCADGAV
ncbi:hypothetical protein IXB50_21795 [Leptothoe spongobia TAU-MAC 1115]|uniref:Uncharacterized protein n=1 Tax=Leptothoe spongobia TAU-MAC 1115 TaxID=1967444 RepID=A0A947DJA6_9CYAN|nr:hypothetical protein [Leptothoe spongobia TAU-MAC 1115]